MTVIRSGSWPSDIWQGAAYYMCWKVHVTIHVHPQLEIQNWVRLGHGH